VRRLAARGIRPIGDVVPDPEIGVVFGLAGPVNGVLLELVAPLGPSAPCVGTLHRNGEGSYHGCWQVSSLEALRAHLAHD